MKMNFSSGARQNRARGKSPGWAAFDLKRQQGALSLQKEGEPFPLISGTPASSTIPSNNRWRSLEKPFSSVLRPTDEFPRLADERTSGRNAHTGKSRKSTAVEVEKLKELHGWANEDLIRDIYEALGGCFSKTTSLLEGMAFDLSVEAEEDEQRARGRNHFARKPSSNGQVADGDPAFGVRTSYQDPKFTPGDANGSTTECTASLPVEPEWEEEDVYLRSRRDAVHAMRSASRHSQSASNAFLRGDHSAAQHHSSKAREHWVSAEKLNNEAAKQILLLRNSNNDVGTLDLHGLHKTEALQALSERLQIIELQAAPNRSVSPNRDNSIHQTSLIPRSSSSGCLPTDKLNKPLTSVLRPLTLQVITGIGKHSKEQAALPTAVRSFLGENGYHFDDIRPGVITVRLKFRCR